MSADLTHLAQAFAKAKSENRALLLGYIPAGFPTKAGCAEIISAMAEGGVDAIEIGFPYSDPVMDGPIIQSAANIALQNKTNMDDLLELAAHAKASGTIALAMTYWNPIEKYGVAKFANNAAAAGISAVITPDLTIEESSEWEKYTNEVGLGRTYVVAPSSSPARLSEVAQKCSGFIYAASLMGVTGVRSEISHLAEKLVSDLRKISNQNICVGLGVSNQAQVKEISQYADGVIVGSAFIRAILEAENITSAVQSVKNLAKELSSGLSR